MSLAQCSKHLVGKIQIVTSMGLQNQKRKNHLLIFKTQGFFEKICKVYTYTRGKTDDSAM